MESLKRSMKAALMTPLVSSLALTWGKAVSQHIYHTASSQRFRWHRKNGTCELGSCITALQQPQHNLHTPDELLFTPRAAELREASPQTHIEIEEGIHLVLNNGDRLEQLLCIHGPHHTIHSEWTHGESEQERAARTEGRWRDRSTSKAENCQWFG